MVLSLAVVLAVAGGCSSGHDTAGHDRTASTRAANGDHAHAKGMVPLCHPGNAIFGAVQEVIQKVETDSSISWSEVDLDTLRSHLLDMQRVAAEVSVADRTPIDGGVSFLARPETAEARSALERVLAAHPRVLEAETGWSMRAESEGEGFRVQVTGSTEGAAEKIRGLGYIGILAYGQHHQRHHWMIAAGSHPHE